MPPAVTIIAFAGDDLGARADDDVDARLHVGVAGLADGGDAAVLDADVGLDDAPVVEDQRVGDHGVDRALGARALALRHAVADGLAAAELHFLAVAAGAQGVVVLDLDHQVGVGQADAVADGRAEHFGVGAASDRCHARAFLAPGRESRRPSRSPAKSTSSTVRCWPGSKRTAVPEAMFSRMPRAASRSKPQRARWSRRSGSASRPGSAGRRCSAPRRVRAGLSVVAGATARRDHAAPSSQCGRRPSRHSMPHASPRPIMAAAEAASCAAACHRGLMRSAGAR